jgi:hypothetical protein
LPIHIFETEGGLMPVTFYTREGCDACCKECLTPFITSLHGERCPKCGTEKPEKISFQAKDPLEFKELMDLLEVLFPVMALPEAASK